MESQFLVPNLAVRNVPAAQAWYRDTLGLRVNWILVSVLELKPWGVREFSIKDPDGNVFRIGRGEGEPAEPERFTVLSEAE
jgi:hypothetical protein